jgi:hypothetical protein
MSGFIEVVVHEGKELLSQPVSICSLENKFKTFIL